jgi:hypothetical protein
MAQLRCHALSWAASLFALAVARSPLIRPSLTSGAARLDVGAASAIGARRINVRRARTTQIARLRVQAVMVSPPAAVARALIVAALRRLTVSGRVGSTASVVIRYSHRGLRHQHRRGSRLPPLLRPLRGHRRHPTHASRGPAGTSPIPGQCRRSWPGGPASAGRRLPRRLPDGEASVEQPGRRLRQRSSSSPPIRRRARSVAYPAWRRC